MTVVKRREGWPTPCASGDLHYRLKGGSQASKCLAVAVYPTPNSRDAKPGTARPHERGLTSTHGQLNPDWEEWLMAWPVGWTDLETPNIRLVWLDPSIDPADYGEIPRITNRRDNRPARVKEIGNGQFPLTAAAAFHWGLCVLQLVNKGEK